MLRRRTARAARALRDDMRGPVDEPERAWAPRRGRFLRDGQFLDQREFLIDDREPRALRVGDRAKMRGRAADFELALVAAVRMHAAEQLDQRRFARAVLAAERVDFAGTQIERNVAQRDDAGEALRDGFRCEDRGGHQRQEKGRSARGGKPGEAKSMKRGSATGATARPASGRTQLRRGPPIAETMCAGRSQSPRGHTRRRRSGPLR